MRHVPALIVGVMLNAALLLFHLLLRGRIKEWSDQGVALSQAEVMLVHLGEIIGAFWFLIGPVMLLLCLAMSVLIRSRPRPDQVGTHA